MTLACSRSTRAPSPDPAARDREEIFCLGTASRRMPPGSAEAGPGALPRCGRSAATSVPPAAELPLDGGSRARSVSKVGEALRLGVDRRTRVAADVLEQPERDLAVPALAPAADDPPLHQTVGPALPFGSKSVAPCGPRYHSRSFQPIVVGSSVGERRRGGGLVGSTSSQRHAGRAAEVDLGVRCEPPAPPGSRAPIPAHQADLVSSRGRTRRASARAGPRAPRRGRRRRSARRASPRS